MISDPAKAPLQACINEMKGNFSGVCAGELLQGEVLCVGKGTGGDKVHGLETWRGQDSSGYTVFIGYIQNEIALKSSML